ncbi:MAG: hypothetical protein ABI742_06805 [Gemmatimonadota bacterium]
MRPHLRVLTSLCVSGLLGGTLHSSLAAQGSITVVDNPGGGQYVYGPIAQGASERAVVVDMLGRIHKRFGESPKVGRVLRDKTGQSLSAFFDVSKGGPGGAPVSGMIILSEPRGRQGTAAVLYDVSKRFPTTAGQMLRSLNGVAAAVAPGNPVAANASTSSAPVKITGVAAKLTQTTFPDGSGSVGLPDGWRITEGMGGYALIEGPKGEWVILSRGFAAWDPRNPQTQQMMRAGPLPGNYVALAYGTDPTKAYLSIVAQAAAKQHRQVPTVQITEAKPVTGPDGVPLTVLTGEMDRHDGAGNRALIVQFYDHMGQPNAQGTWFLVLFQFLIPKPLLEQERATLAAIRRSYRENGAVIQSQNQEGLRRARMSFEASQAANRANQAAFESRQESQRTADESQGKRNQAFSNYLLDQTAITDTRTGEQGTVSNGYAQSLMQANSNFQEVPTEDLLKGVTW